MNTVNTKELTQKLNEFISKNANKAFTGKELHDAIVSLGFSEGIAYRVTSSLFPFEQAGKNRLYEVPKKPIYIGLVEGLYKSSRRKKKSSPAPVEDKFQETMEVTNAIKLLVSKGYKVQKPLGLDTKQLLKDHPEIAKTYMRYETL